MLRFATSPTSDMNIGNLRIALFNYIVSKQKEEDLIIRIEDTNKEKNIEGIDKETPELLGLFGIEFTQVIYQSESVRFHTAMALQLMHEKKAFSCFCSDEWIDKKREEAKYNKVKYRYDDACANLPAELVIDNLSPFRIRIVQPSEGEQRHLAEPIDSFIILDQNKTPTYDFSCSVDDMLNNISIVICSENQIENTPKQIHIRESLEYDKQIEYVHVPLLIDDTLSVKRLLEEGFLPEAISNYLISTGNDTPCEIFTLAEAIEWFDLKKMSCSPTHFDIGKLRHINHEHLALLDAKELSRYVGFADIEIGKLAKVYLEEVSTTQELKLKISAIFNDKDIPQELTEQVILIKERIKSAPYFEEYTDFIKYITKEKGIEEKNFFKALRLILTGATKGPDLENIYKYLKNYIGEIVK